MCVCVCGWVWVCVWEREEGRASNRIMEAEFCSTLVFFSVIFRGECLALPPSLSAVCLEHHNIWKVSQGTNCDILKIVSHYMELQILIFGGFRFPRAFLILKQQLFKWAAKTTVRFYYMDTNCTCFLYEWGKMKSRILKRRFEPQFGDWTLFARLVSMTLT